MSSAAKEINFIQSSYEVLKADYDAKHAATNQSWVAEIKAAKTLQESKSWQSLAPNWDSYCDSFMPYKANTYNVYQASVPIAELVETVTGVTILEGDARKLKKVIKETCPDKSLILPSYQLAVETSKQNIPPRQHLQAAYKAVQELKASGTVSLDTGESVNVADLVMQTAALQNLLEIQKTAKQNIIDHAAPRKRLTKQVNQADLAYLQSFMAIEDLPEIGEEIYISLPIKAEVKS